MKHLDTIRQKVRVEPKSAPGHPWSHISTFAIGGLRAIGFDRDSELLLIESSQGRGVVDASIGRKVARDDDDKYHVRELELEAEGIGPLEGKIVRMAGLMGGGMPIVTGDRWSLSPVCLDWPTTYLLLFAPDSWLYGSLQGMPDSFVKIASDSEFRAFGFSYSGKSLVIATASDLVIYGRNLG